MRTLLFSLLMALFLIASCQWADAQTMLLNENFDNITSGVPTGWDDNDYNCASSYRWKSDASGYNGTRCMRFNTYSASSGSYSTLKTPVLNLNQAFVLRFKYKNYNAGTLGVYISTDGGATYLNEPLSTSLTTPDASTWQEVEYSLSAYTGQSNVRIVFYGVSNYGSQRQYIDDVVVESAPTCKAPIGIYVTNMTTTTATLNWGLSQDGDDPGLFQLTVTDEGGDTILTDNNVGGTTTSRTITGLTANTTYTATMRGDCSGTLRGYSKYASITFTTACEAVSIPYSEDFDALTDVPDCTHSLNASIQTGTIYGTSGKSLKITATTTDNAYIVFPALNHAANDLQMTFYAKSSVSSGLNYQVGIVTDPYDIEGTFEPLRTGSFTDNTTWHEIRMNTADASTSASPVMMCIFLGSGRSASIFIDNVSIVQTPNCIRPEQLTASNPTANSVTLDWTTSNAQEHIINIEDPDGNTSTVTATAHPYTVTGLQPNTQYSFRLRALCGVGDTSEYAPGIATARTLCVPLTTTIWSEGAEETTGTALPDCWLYGFMNRTTSGSSYDQPFATQTNTVHSGTRAFKLMDMASGNISYLTSPGFPIATANQYQASIWVYRPAGTSYVGEGLRLFASNNPDNTEGAQELGFINRCAGNAPVETAGAGWYNYTFPISMTGTVYLIIQGESKYGSATNFDDISIELAPTCTPPSMASLGTITPDNDIDLTWSAGVSGETSWTLAYELMIGNSVVTSDSIEVTNPSYTFTNLSAATTYNVKARIYAMCNATDISAARNFTGTFSTPCGTVTSFPYVQDFEGGAVPPTCWSQTVVSTSTTGSYSNTWNISSTQKHSGAYSAAIPDKQVGCKTALTTGALDFSDPAGYQVSFWQYRPANSYQSKVDEAMHVFVHPTDALDEATAVEIGVVNNHYLNAPAEAAAGWYQYTFDVPKSLTGIQHVSFCYHNQYGSGSFIDDVMIRVAPNCRDLAAPVISDIQPTSARVAIDDTTATAWDISYGPAGTTAEAGTIVTVTGAQDYVLTGLTANTTYYVYVRRNCGTEVGMWTLAPVSFTAICTDATATTTDADPYTFTVKANTTSWEIAYGVAGTSAEAGIIIPVSGTDEYTVTGLAPATQYVYYVRHDCGGGDYSAWSSAYSIKTTVIPDTIPVTTGFEDDADNAQWTIVDGTNTINTFTFGTDANAVASGSKALYIQTSNAYGYYTSSATKTYAYRTIHFGSGVHSVCFRWKCTGGESTWDFARVMLVPASEPLIGGTGTSFSNTVFPNYTDAFDPIEGKGYINLASGDANGWNTYQTDIDMTGREGTYNFVVMWSNDGSAGTAQYPISIDNLSITQVACNKPTVQASDITSTGVTITAAAPTAPQFEVAVSDSPIDVFGTVTGNIYQGVTSAPVAITGLNVNTPYYYTARAICGVGDTSDWTEVQTVRTACDAYSLPYNEDFEDVGALLCWSSDGTGIPTRNTVYKYAGNASCRVNNTVAISPALNVTTLASSMLNGWVYTTVDSVQFAVGIMVDPTDVTSYEHVTTVTVPTRNTWTEFTAYFNVLNDPDYADFYNAQHFAIVATADVNIYVDNIYLGDIPTCLKPTESYISNVLANSFTMSWTENGTATSWRIKAIPDNPALATIDTVVTTNPATVTGLEAASGYNIEIQAICSATDTSLTTICGHIKTTCSIVNTPYEETFEFMTANALPDCWDNSASTTTTLSSNNPWYVWGVYETGNNKMLRMYNYLVSSGSAVINTPVIALGNTNASSLTFDYCHQSSSPELYVLISNNGGTTWDTIGTYAGASGSKDAPSSWNTATIGLNSYIGQNVIIRFANEANYGNGAIFLDNVKVRQSRNCADLVGINVNYSDTIATVNINDTASTHTQWQYMFGPAGFDTTGIIPVLIDTPYFTLNLAAATAYDIYVRAYCDAAEQSNWVFKSFKTTTAPAPLPYICDFENPAEANLWQLLGDGQANSFMVGNGTYHSAGNSLYITEGGNANSYSVHSATVSFATRIFHLTAGQYAYSYNWNALGESNYDYGRAFLVPASTVLNPGTLPSGVSTTGVPAGGYALDGNSPLNMSSDWQNQSGLVQVAQNGSYLMVFMWHNDASVGNQPPLAIDDIQFYLLTCPQPTVSVIASSITETSASVVVDNPNESDVLVYAVSLGSVDDAFLTGTVTGQDTITVTGLAAATDYNLYVKARCSADDESPWTQTSFRTLCGQAVLPYTQGFETLPTTYSGPGMIEIICWNDLNAGAASNTYPYYKGNNTHVAEGNQSLQAYSSNNTNLFLILPSFGDATDLSVSFDAMYEYLGYSGTFYLGYMTDPADETTFTSLFTAAGSTNNQYESYTAYLRNIPAGARLAFMYGDAGSTNYYAWLDNIRISEFVSGPTYNDTVCFSEPYMEHGFSIPAAYIQVGNNAFIRTLTGISGAPDTIIVANIFKYADIRTVTYDEVYDIDLPYMFRGQDLYESGVYYDTLMAYNGCDSIIELNLTVNQFVCAAPVNLVAEMTGNRQITLTWENVGIEPDNYTIYYKRTNSPVNPDSYAPSAVAVDTTAYVVNNVSFASMYHIYVKNVYRGVSSDWVEVAFTTHQQYRAVDSLTVSDVATNSFNVAWTKAQYASETAWKVDVTETVSGTLAFTTVTTVENCAVTGLNPETEYTVTVTPKFYSTVFGPAVSTTATTAAMPAQPINLVAEVTGARQVTFTWENGGTDAANYTVFYKKTAASVNPDAFTPVESGLTEGEYVVDNTSFESVYYFYVKNVVNGISSEWTEVSVTTPVQYPAVQNITVSDITFTTLNVAWTKGQYAPETAWKVEVIETATSTVAFTSVVSVENCAVTGLTPGTEYTVTVTPKIYSTVFGPAASTSATTVALPAQPINLVATMTAARQVTFTWDNGGTDAANYTVFYKKTAASVNPDAFTPVESGLTEGEYVVDNTSFESVYYFYVKNVVDGVSSEWTEVSVTTPVQYPAVQNITVSDVTSSTFNVAWTKGQFAPESSWKVEVTETVSGTLVFTKTVSVQNCAVNGLTPETGYTVTVTPKIYSTLFGAPASADATTASVPAAPIYLVATVTGARQITFTWDNGGTDPANYTIFYKRATSSLNPDAYTPSATGLTEGEFVLNKANVGAEYRFYVKNVVNGESSAWVEVSAIINAPGIAPEDGDGFIAETITPADAFVSMSRLHVENLAEGTDVTIIDAAGRTLYNAAADNTHLEYDLTVRGVYTVILRGSQEQILRVVY